MLTRRSWLRGYRLHEESCWFSIGLQVGGGGAHPAITCYVLAWLVTMLRNETKTAALADVVVVKE